MSPSGHGRLVPTLGCALALAVVAQGAVPDEDTRLNQIQVIGTHNSYHRVPVPSVMALIAAATGRERAESLDYEHVSLTEQFERQGIRQIELDLFLDPAGGLFSSPAARLILKRLGKGPGPSPNVNGALREPGLKVLHVPDVDYLSTVPTFIAALREIRDWSRAHPRHVPIFILLELKDEAIPGLPTRPLEFDQAGLAAVEREVRSVFSPEEVLTPDDVRGSFATLSEAIRDRGWPRLDAVRGRALFALDNTGKLANRYLEGHPALQGRLLFVSVDDLHDPAAAWFKVNDPVRDFERITDLVRGGFLVRTRADADTRASRLNDTAQRDRALASGAQFVSTDYPSARLDFSTYHVELPGGVIARPNPVSGPIFPSGHDFEGVTVPAGFGRSGHVGAGGPCR